MTQQAARFEKDIVQHVSLDYLLHLPPGYGEGDQRWPLVFFLHGAGERGSNLELVKKHGIPQVAERDPSLPFVAVSPQCPEEHWWPMEMEALHALLQDVLARYAIDTRRVYLTGLSMGGYGSWHLGARYPELFAAVVPICGGMSGPARAVCALKGVPVWAFHGAKDPTVPLEQSQRLVDALRECGGDARLTIYPECGHDAWTETYDNPALYTWLLAQSK